MVDATSANSLIEPAFLVDDTRFDEHRAAGYHPERPERLVAARQAVEKTQVDWSRIQTREATDDELARVHEPAFLEMLSKARGKTGYLDPDTYVSAESISIARRAAGGVVEMVDAILGGSIETGVALVRPPGHHARASQAMGFCLFNNVAVAAAHARARGIERVLIVDWDVHHGNGTQEMFWKDPNVLFISLHQFPFYPGTGDVDEIGAADGARYTVNVPLSAGADDAIYRAAFERVVLPVAEQYAPELVLVSAGFDASARDPLAEMQLSETAFGWMAAKLRAVAKRSAKGRMAMILEGGYDLVGIEQGLDRAIRGMLGIGAESEIASERTTDDVVRAKKQAAVRWKV